MGGDEKEATSLTGDPLSAFPMTRQLWPPTSPSLVAAFLVDWPCCFGLEGSLLDPCTQYEIKNVSMSAWDQFPATTLSRIYSFFWLWGRLEGME